jgi:hypothetical protein
LFLLLGKMLLTGPHIHLFVALVCNSVKCVGGVPWEYGHVLRGVMVQDISYKDTVKNVSVLVLFLKMQYLRRRVSK